MDPEKTPDSPLTPDNRRRFMKRSLAAGIVASQPALLTGLIRAQGGGGGETTTDPWESTGTTDPWETTDTTTDTTGTTTDTTDPQTTLEKKVKMKEFTIRLYLKNVTGSGDYEFTKEKNDADLIDHTNDSPLPWLPEDPGAGWPDPSILDPDNPQLGGFDMENVDTNHVYTNADLRDGYPKIFPEQEASAFVEEVEVDGQPYNVKGYELTVYYLWVYEDEPVPPEAEDAESADGGD